MDEFRNQEFAVELAKLLKAPPHTSSLALTLDTTQIIKVSCKYFIFTDKSDIEKIRHLANKYELAITNAEVPTEIDEEAK